MLQRSINCKHS